MKQGEWTLSLVQVARRFGVSPATVIAWNIPCLAVPNKCRTVRRYRESDLAQFEQRHIKKAD